MDSPPIVVLLTLVGVTIIWLIFALTVAGSLGRYFSAVKLGLRWLKDPTFATKVDELSAPPKPPKPNPEPVRLLTLLQRDGRLLDFLMEDVAGASDTDLGAGVREIHRNCQKVLKEHLVLEPVMSQEENASVEVPAGFDPSAVRLTGNVTGQPPFKGTLIHRGWRVKEVKLGPLAEGQDHFVVQPAEVELA